MKKSVLLFFAFVSIFGSVAAQAPGGAPATQPVIQKGNAKLSGTVIDADDNTPVEFANVALLDPATGKPVDGGVCDDKGTFSLTKVAEGTYTVSISFIGYEPQTITGIKVDKKADLNLGVIKLSTGAKVLNEVVVEGQKQLVEERVDRTIYNAENDQTTKGGDATDVLKRVPMLSVDMDGNVTLRGSQNIKVLINNKPSTIMASSIADALKQIPADQIKTVEVITSPSAKYDAEGSGGIINIVTKKNTLQGATLSVDTGVGLRGSNLGLNGSYRKGKMGFSLGGWGRTNYNVTGSFDNTQNIFDANRTPISTTQQRADTRSNGLFGNYTLGWDYDIDKKNSLAASVRFGARNNKSYQDNLYTQTTNFTPDPDSSFTVLRDAFTKDLSNTVDVNLTYTRTFDKPQREFSILALYSKNNRTNNFDNRTKQVNDLDNFSGVLNLNNSYNQESTIQADYQTPLGSNQLLEMGAKDIMRKVYSNFSLFEDPDGDGQYVLNTEKDFSNNLNYNQNIASGYLSYTLSTKSGYAIKAGSRYEYTTIDAYTKTEDNINIPSYGVIVPSVNVSRKLKNGGMVKAAYNRRIQRPSIQFLNPNIQASNPLSITQGNPSLNPEYTNNYELSYSTFIQGTSLNFTSFMRNTTGSIQSVRNPTGDPVYPGQIRTTYENIGTEDAYGLSVFANVNIGKLSLNGGSDVYYAKLDNHVDAQNQGWVASGRLFGSYNLNKGWGFQFFSFYRGRQVQLQGSQGGFGIYSLGIKKDINDKKGSIGFGAENFFTPNFRIHGNITTPTIEQKSLNINHTMSFRVNFSYRIGKMSVDARPKRRRSINNDDLKDGGDGGGDAGGQQGGGGGQRSGGGAPATGQRAAGIAATTAPALPPADAAAVVNAAGSWSYTVDSPQGGDGTITIVKEGEGYTGTITSRRGTNTLSDVKVNGNEITFHYDVNSPNGTMTIQTKAIIDGDKMTGNIAVGQFGTFPLQATRAAQEKK
ncbi:TonB-dependent receptor domain-containing protein [Chryseolinea lacunae]|uniref:TonB-dependent receptor n=1 Tax=Chryseolinea lacunae TaxID=2801331 RepID=A0ABS1KLY7_9BACT|nr:TonB-dependent receptor [Chryseolinea lacunae]MBL0740252.1 TonB-dependent receptor [Chryseolinea lacunae]